MTGSAARLVEVWRGEFCENVHHGHVAIWHAEAGLIGAFGDVEAAMLPRSSSKILQALPLVESGAAAAFGLTTAQLALACASHSGAAIHTDLVDHWLADLGLDETAFRCGSNWPRDEAAHHGLIRAHMKPDQRHNVCSGKHSGFLTLGKHLAAGPEYIEIDHPVQRAVREAFEDVTGAPSLGFVTDGCSAPNFACSLANLARAMATFAAADGKSGTRAEAMVTLRDAMIAYPELVAGEGRASTRLSRQCKGRVALKSGAEAVYVGMVPEMGVGLAIKIADGNDRVSEAAVAQILTALGILDPADPVAQDYRVGPITNLRKKVTGRYKLTEPFASWRP